MPLARGVHYSVQERMKRQREERENLPFRGAIYSKVVSPASEVEMVNVESVVGSAVINYAYPFASTNAWIRGQPETGTTMLSIIGGDSKDLQPIGYFDPLKRVTAASYQNTAAALRQNPLGPIPAVSPYRTLTPGDIDIGSRFAQTFLGLKDVHQSRGGLSHITMTSLKTVVETPQFEVRGPAHEVGHDLSDEIRFGTVRRASASGKTAVPSLVRVPSAVSNPFAKEWSVAVNWLGVPNKLIDHRQGIVVDNFGTQVRGQKTSQPLRAKYRWFGLADDTTAEIDESGNFLLRSSLHAVSGGVVEIPTGSFLLDVGQQATLRSKGDFEVSSLIGRLLATAATGFRVTTPARGEVEALGGLTAKSLGLIRVDTPMPLGVQIGAPTGVKYPVLVANANYLATQGSWLSAEVAVDNQIAVYGAAAAAAWSAVGALMTLLDPTLAVSQMCLQAASAATAMATAGISAGATLGAHMPTLSSMPGGYISGKVASE